MKQASELRVGNDYSLFKQGIQPMWEDDANKNGGRWLINLDRKQRATELDRFWLETVLCMIGEGFQAHSDDVCGAVINIRNKQDKLSVWTTNYSNQASILEIG
jgi:translation initiation factor 4E